MGGLLVNCQLPSGLSPGSEGKWWGDIKPASSLNLPSSKELVFLCHKYYFILAFCCNRKLVPYEIQL
jgi:hypothetical protein